MALLGYYGKRDTPRSWPALALLPSWNLRVKGFWRTSRIDQIFLIIKDQVIGFCSAVAEDLCLAIRRIRKRESLASRIFLVDETRLPRDANEVHLY